ncbi:hypothetical protein [Actinomadura kijaniata]|uniref:hypothetical protein n=1 Tax=Actinomadura kijaniata TaxID=46161 RepID=UPI000B11128D|nr:hypothetical protein [Actinomadura kijaniata]
MRHLRTPLGMALVLAACVALPTAASPVTRSPVGPDTTVQLTAAARALVETRSRALVAPRRPAEQRPPVEVLGVRISPDLVRRQEHAVRELETRNRAPVAGGPAFTEARTRLAARRTVRVGDLITLEAVEHTEVRYDTGAVTQSVRRGFDFRERGEQFVLVRERVLDPAARPINDPDESPAR